MNLYVIIGKYALFKMRHEKTGRKCVLTTSLASARRDDEQVSERRLPIAAAQTTTLCV